MSPCANLLFTGAVLLCRGRGNEFLRHLERVRCIAYIVDLTGGREANTLVELTPEEQLQVLQVGGWCCIRRSASFFCASSVQWLRCHKSSFLTPLGYWSKICIALPALAADECSWTIWPLLSAG